MRDCQRIPRRFQCVYGGLWQARSIRNKRVAQSAKQLRGIIWTSSGPRSGWRFLLAAFGCGERQNFPPLRFPLERFQRRQHDLGVSRVGPVNSFAAMAQRLLSEAFRVADNSGTLSLGVAIRMQRDTFHPSFPARPLEVGRAMPLA